MLSHCLILSTCALLVLAVDPYSLGPHPVDHVTINPEFMGELDHYLEIYTPRLANKRHMQEFINLILVLRESFL